MMKQTAIFFVILSLFPLVGKTQVQVGDSKNYYAKGIPIKPRFNFTYSQVIYLAAEINTSGTITQLKWDYNGGTMTHSNTWVIYIGHTTKTHFNSISDWIPVSAMTQVWSGTFPDPGSSPLWITIDISDWTYNGTDNIVVAVDENDGNTDSYVDNFNSTPVTEDRALYYAGNQNADPGSPPIATEKEHYVANIIFDGISQNMPQPTNLAQNNIVLNGANLNWTENGTATKWNIEWRGNTDFTPGTGHANGTATATSKPYYLSGLTANMTYYWYVRSDYRVEAGVGVSDWSGPGIFTTSNGKATNPSPSNGQGNVRISETTLDWDDVSGSTGYHITIGTTNGGNDVVNNAPTAVSNYTYGSNWNYGTDYYWSIVTDYNTNSQVGGDTWNFTTCNSVNPPYFQDFDNVATPDLPNCMETENDNSDSFLWETNGSNFYSSSCSAGIAANPSVNMNDWVFTPGLNLTAGFSYEVSFFFKADNSAYPEKLSVDYGTSASGAAMSGSPAFDETNLTNTSWKSGKITISPTTTDTYYVGFHGYSNAGSRGIYLDDIRIVEVASSTDWVGSSNTDWDETGNWSAGIPSSTTDVNLLAGKPHYPVLTHSVECHNLKINAGALLTIPSGKNLTVNGNLINNSAAVDFIIASDANGNGSLIVVGSITGDATVQRFVPAFTGVSDGWHEIGCPVTSFAVSATDWDPLHTGTNNDLYYWNEGDNEWKNYRSSAFDFIPEKGYLIANDADITHEFSGTLNNSDITVTGLSNTSGQGNGWHLLGNPFPCPVAWNNGHWVLTNVYGTAKIWDYTNNPGNYTDLPANGVIPSTNGFFIQVEAGKTGAVTIPKAARITDITNNYKSETHAINKKELRIKVTNDQNIYTDRVVVGFRSDATDKTDPVFDSHKLFGTPQAPQLWSVSNGEQLSTNYLPYGTSGIHLPLMFRAGVNAMHHLLINGQDSYSETCNLYLEDLKTGNMLNLKNNSIYNFMASVNDDSNRFVLHFYNITDVPVIEQPNPLVLVYCHSKTVLLQSIGKYMDGSVEIVNLWGQVVFTQKIHQTKAIEIATTLQKGIYIVYYRQKNGYFQTDKIFIN